LSVFLGIVAVVCWTLFRPLPFPDGVAAPAAPRQTPLARAKPFFSQGYEVTPVAGFDCEALVLSARHYSWGRTAHFAPVDLALGWGPMSDGRVVRRIRVNQFNRFYHWWAAKLPLPAREIETHSANMHLIPADGDVARAIRSARRGQRVHFDGYLVNVKAADGWTWKSSLTRDDTGWGACEVVWVKDFEVLE
jgi:hypothetical protein